MLTGGLALVAAGVRHGPGLLPQGAQEPTRCPSMLMLDSEIICQALTVGRGRAVLLTGPEVPACRPERQVHALDCMHEAIQVVFGK